MQLGHVVEVHAVDAGDGGGHERNGGPGGDLAHVLVLPHGDLVLPQGDLALPCGDAGEVGLQDVGQQPVVTFDGVRGAQDVVMHVAEVRRRTGCDAPYGAVGQTLQGGGQRQHRPAELCDLALELVDALGVVVGRPG